jgi:hypothetical protein
MTNRNRAVAAASGLAAVVAAVYLLLEPASQDLAAATFRADIFSEHGFALWNNQWYSGHYLLSYSVLYPPLGALLGPRLTGALAAVAAAALFAILAERWFGEGGTEAGGRRALAGSLWFAAAVSAWLFTGRITFLLAVPFGLAALLAADSGRNPLAGGLAALATLASPVAGLFTGLAGVSIWLAGRRRPGTWLALGSAIPMLALNVAFPVGGVEPFVFSAFIALPLLAALVVWLVPAEYRALRIGAVLYAAFAVVIFVVSTPLGGNVTRLGALFAGPVLLLVLWPRGRWVVLAVSLPLLYWQLIAPVRDVRKAAGDESTEAAFYEPLVAELDRLAAAGETFRVEIPPTKNRWEAVYVAERHPLARGWLRQLESDDFDLFKDGNLDAESYREWLADHAVTYVAVPDASRDVLAEDEAALIEGGLDYLEPLWDNEDWALYRVDDASSSGLAGRHVSALEPAGGFTVEAPRPGVYPTSIEWSRHWSVTGGDGCVREASPPGTTEVEARRANQVITVEQRLAGGDDCGR